MPQLTQAQFETFLDQDYSHIPVYRKLLVDFQTPLSIYNKLVLNQNKSAYTYLLESVQGGEQLGRYSVIGLGADEIIRISGHELTIQNGDTISHQETLENPLEWVEHYQAKFKEPIIEKLPRYAGGLVGYFGYDTIRYVEKKLANTTPADELNLPDILLMYSSSVAVFDNVQSMLYLIVHAKPTLDDFNAAQEKLDILESQIKSQADTSALVHLPKIERDTPQSPTFHMQQDKYQNAVKHIKEYIAAGDVMQVVPAQRMSIDFEASPLSLYRALRFMNPSPYMFYLDLEDFHIVGSSPEILVRKEGDKAVVRPIAGTRPRGQDAAEDNALAEDLLADQKEIAEHVMLIDLGRNDIGRVANIGKVELTEKMIIEKYSHVMHIVSNVEGEVNPEISAMDVLAATFPAGTLSGAPKVRAMEIIDEVETVKRGIYGGAVGALSFNGDMDLAIAIRTGVIKNKRLYVQAGAGVVADSVPEKEWEETLNKAKAVLRAAELAEQGLAIKGANS